MTHGMFATSAAVIFLTKPHLHIKKRLNGATGKKNLLKFLPLIKKEAVDDRNFVRKAVNWALRQIGKRNLNLNGIAIKTAKEILEINSKTAKWVASNALAELTNKKVQKRLREREAGV